jgi:hypothetical protein
VVCRGGAGSFYVVRTTAAVNHSPRLISAVPLDVRGVFGDANAYIKQSTARGMSCTSFLECGGYCELTSRRSELLGEKPILFGQASVTALIKVRGLGREVGKHLHLT